MVGETFQPHAPDPDLCPFFALAFVDALHLEAIDDVLQHVTVRQEPEFLEHHRRLVAAEFQQIRFVEATHVRAAIEDFAGGRVDQPVDVADQRRFARAGKAHDNGDLPARHGDVDIAQAEHMAMFGVEIDLGHAGLDGFDIVSRLGAENLVEAANFDRLTSHAPLPGVFAGEGHRPG